MTSSSSSGKLKTLGLSLLAIALLLPAVGATLWPSNAPRGTDSMLTVKGPSERKMNIQEVKSPGGIKAWLVEDHSVPLFAMRFAFQGGNSQDPAGKEGTANFLSAMLDEGAGDLNAQAFQERIEDLAIKMGFEEGTDWFYGRFSTLTDNRDAAVEMLRLALNKPRFDADAVERIRKQLLTSIAFAERDPGRVAGKAWDAAAFPDHPYGRPGSGTVESVKAIKKGDLEALRKRVFARNTLKVAVVGDIDAKTLGTLLDQVFGDLPEKAELVAVPEVAPAKGGIQKVIEMDVPQSVARFGFAALPRKHPDFVPAFVLNHIIGGGGFSSRLMEEVREKRGLAYSVYSQLAPFRHASIMLGAVATKNEEIGQSLDVIKAQLTQVATEGPTAKELEDAKNYLTGSYALRFDTSTKIASQLLAIQTEDLGIDYVNRRNKEVEAVTLEDVKRVGKMLMKTDDLIVVIVGKPKNLKGSPG
ncbi:MAG: hypothetical protein RLZ98_1606 [Pseudomonadota bacterium]|jgi:zinc protease